MRENFWRYAFLAVGLGATAAFVFLQSRSTAPEGPATTLAEANAGPAPAEPTNADPALFFPIAAVLREPRCMNCHPRGDRPRQGDDAHVHLQNVVRGPDNLGFTNARCTACHRDENNAYSGVPGAPNWHLAPLSMGWEGLDDNALCTTLKDTKANGGKDVAALVEHMTTDKLVLWGWAPGGKRKPVATPHAEFVTQLQAWAAAGAPCPAKASK
ncbi:MAG: hypothetical protein ACT4OU_08900 [Hyphomicrobium sp.]